MKMDEILAKVSVDCKDNGRRFIVDDRIRAIREILDGSAYSLLRAGNLCYIYGKRDVRNSEVVLISSHIDCVFSNVFYREENEDYYLGTFDNTITNACVLYDMIHNKLPDNVIVAFTGDEEEDSGGALEVVRILRQWNCKIKMGIVLDVTEEGWVEKCPFTVENDLGIDIMSGYKLIKTLDQYRYKYKFVHDAEPDETWDYDEEDIPCFGLCMPIHGDMHSESGVLVRKSSLPVYSDVLAALSATIIK